jgi:hypothetical protein
MGQLALQLKVAGTGWPRCWWRLTSRPTDTAQLKIFFFAGEPAPRRRGSYQ